MLQEVGFVSYSGYPYLRAIQWLWSSALTVGLVHDSLDQTMVCFWVTFWFQNCNSGRLSMMILCVMLDFVHDVFLSWKTGKKIQLAS